MRNVPPLQTKVLAHSHDTNVLQCFREIFQIPALRQWDDQLHKVSFGAWVKQARLPLRLGGCGLRNSNRTSHAAYWASWADCMPDLIKRFPHIRHELVGEFAALQALDADEPHGGTACVVAAEMAGKWCQEHGWTARPLWVDIANGTRPPERASGDVALGEWQHGWQFHASAPAEQKAWDALLLELAPHTTRSNAASAGKARLHSCMGAFSSVWLTVSPTTTSLCISNMHRQCAVRRRLGIAATF